MAEERVTRRGKGGGPKTAAGKTRSSRNAIKHGILATAPLVLQDERAEDYDEVERGWRTQFEPSDYQEERLVRALIRNDWMHQRAEKRLLEADARLAGTSGGDASEWSEEEHQRIGLIQRYKTSAERSFYRSWSALQGLRREIMRVDKEKAELQLRLAKHELREEAQRVKDAGPRAQDEDGGAGRSDAVSTGLPRGGGRGAKKKRRKVATLEQWVEVETGTDGKTVTTQYPPNELLLERRQTMRPAPELVYRRLHFVGGVPAEYAWTTADEAIRASGGMGMQRMKVDTWLKLIEKEAAVGTGHLLPCGGNVPRPAERGGCECEVCVRNRGIFEAREG